MARNLCKGAFFCAILIVFFLLFGFVDMPPAKAYANFTVILELNQFAGNIYVIGENYNSDYESLSNISADEESRTVVIQFPPGEEVTFQVYPSNKKVDYQIRFGAGQLSIFKGNQQFFCPGSSVINISLGIKQEEEPPAQVYSVSFILEGGTTQDTHLLVQQIEEGNAAAAPQVTPPEGYDFVGWDKEFDQVLSDLTVTAQYEIIKFTVRFYCFDRLLDTQTIEYGEGAIAPTPPDIEGKVFACWDSEFCEVKENIDIYALYNDIYTVTFYGFGGVVIDTVAAEQGQGATAPLPPAVDGYRFMGWDKPFDCVEGDLEVYADYKRVFKVVFDLDGGSAAGELTQFVLDGENADPPSQVTKTGYEFMGWNISPDAITAEKADAQGEVHIRATYEINTYTVKYYLEEGYLLLSSPHYYLQPLNVSLEPEKAGHYFVGWQDGQGNVYNENYLVENDIDLFAMFEKNTYAVTFYDGDRVVEVFSVQFGNVTPISYNTDKNGYTFIRWCEDEALTCEYYFTEDNPINGNTAIYAKYELNNVTVSISDNMQGEYQDIIVPAFSLLELSPPTLQGYKVDIAAFDNSGEEYAVQNTSIALSWKDVEVTYIYQRDTYYIDFLCPLLPEAAPGRISALYEQQIALPAIEVYGYDFLGYYRDENFALPADITVMPYSARADKSTTIFAKLAKQRFAVTFDTAGAPGIASIQGEYKDVIDLSPFVPQKHNMEFLGWREGQARIAEPSAYLLERNVTLTADYKIIREYFDINFSAPSFFEFNLSGGNTYISTVACPQSISVRFTESPADLPLPQAEGYTFAGWFVDEQLSQEYTPAPVIEDITLYGKFEIIELTVKFHCRNRTIEKKVEYYSPMPAPDPTQTMCEYYTFTGWDKNVDYIKEDTEFIGLYTPLYNIVILDNANQMLTKPQDCNLEEFLSSVQLDLKEDEVFLGWTLGSYDEETHTYSYVPNIIKIEPQSESRQYMLYLSLLINLALAVVIVVIKLPSLKKR